MAERVSGRCSHMPFARDLHPTRREGLDEFILFDIPDANAPRNVPCYLSRGPLAGPGGQVTAPGSSHTPNVVHAARGVPQLHPTPPGALPAPTSMVWTRRVVEEVGHLPGRRSGTGATPPRPRPSTLPAELHPTQARTGKGGQRAGVPGHRPSVSHPGRGTVAPGS